MPVLKKSRWLLLKREQNLKTEQLFRLRDLLRYNLKTVRAYLLKEAFQQLWDYSSPDTGCQVPRRLVSAGDALPHRAHEEDRPVTARSPRTDPQLFPRSEAALQRGSGLWGPVPSLVNNRVGRNLRVPKRFRKATG